MNINFVLLIALMLSLAIITHEIGHYIFAKLFGVRVMRVSLFFNPIFTLLKYDPSAGRIYLISKKKAVSISDEDGTTDRYMGEWSLLSFPVHAPRTVEIADEDEQPEISFKMIRGTGMADSYYDTEAKKLVPFQGILWCQTVLKMSVIGEKDSWRDSQYCLGWVPCGGYVSFFTHQAECSITSKKPYQQFIISSGGVLFNLFFVFLSLLLVKMIYLFGTPGVGSDMLMFFAYISFGLAIINILPFPGLDGSQMLLAILRYILPQKANRILLSINSIVSIAVFIFMCSVLFRPISGIEQTIFNFTDRIFEGLLRIFGIL